MPYHHHLHTPLRSQPTFSASSQSFTSKLLLLLTLLPLTLASLALVLQWCGGITGPSTRWSPPGSNQFPGMESSPLSAIYHHSNPSNCVNIGRSASPSFPYLNDWKFDILSSLKPKICITTSTSAGLEQILPWMFYHKVIGVTNFFLFVEGNAASPNVTKVLESIPAFIIASTATEEEMLSWYHEHVLWSDKDLKIKLLRKGILTRIFAPMVIIEGLRNFYLPSQAATHQEPWPLNLFPRGNSVMETCMHLGERC